MTAQDLAAGAIDIPIVMTGHAEFDIPADAGKSLAFLNQIIDLGMGTIGQERMCLAIAAADRSIDGFRLVMAFPLILEAGDGDAGLPSLAVRIGLTFGNLASTRS